MKMDLSIQYANKFVLALMLAALALPALAQQPNAAERVAQLKTIMTVSQNILRQYEWIESTVISVKGETKSQKQHRCYYGADGALQKIELSSTPPPEKKRGLRGRIAASKQEDLTEYMQAALALVKAYVPPDPARLQASKESGKVSIDVLKAGQRARLNFLDYEKPGDSLGVEVDLGSNRPLSLKVSTYLKDAKDSVTLDVRMGELNDGASHPTQVTLDGKAKKLRVVVNYGGYRKM